MELLGVLLGGLLAVGGGAAAQWYSHKLKIEDDERRRRAVKYEELVAAIYEFDHWLQVLRGIRVIGKEGEEPLSPLGKAHAITCAYFPSFVDQLKELDLLASEYQRWMLRKGRERLDNKVDILSGGMDEVYKPYTKARFALLRDLGAFAGRGFK
jgi:hypothetical protein